MIEDSLAVELSVFPFSLDGIGAVGPLPQSLRLPSLDLALVPAEVFLPFLVFVPPLDIFFSAFSIMAAKVLRNTSMFF